MYDKAGSAMLPVTGVGLFTGSVGMVLLAIALVGVGIALYRIAPRFSRGK